MPSVILLPIDQILIQPNRQRKVFDPAAMESLKVSIEEEGLLQAPVIRMRDGQAILVAGERRLKAIADMHALNTTVLYAGQIVPLGQIPATNLGELTMIQSEAAELAENYYRENLTWQEEAGAIERLAKLRKAEYSEAVKDAVAKAEATGEPVVKPAPPTQASLAEELRVHQPTMTETKVSQALQLAQAMRMNPDVAKAKDAKTAVKLVKKAQQEEEFRRLADVVGKSDLMGQHRLLNVDCLVEMAKPEYQGYFDLIVTDPPYGMGADTFGDGGSGRLAASSHVYDDSPESWRKLMRAWAPLTIATTKPDSHLYAFCDFDNFHELSRILSSAGWNVFRTPFVYHKVNSGRVPIPNYGPRRTYELVLFAYRGEKHSNGIYPDVFEAEADQQALHGATKPVACMANLLLRSARPGDKVLDCFAGTGPTLHAGHQAKCEVTCMEMSELSFGQILARKKFIESLDSPIL